MQRVSLARTLANPRPQPLSLETVLALGAEAASSVSPLLRPGA
jgi:hypothetical protein